MFPEGSANPLRSLFDAAVRQYAIQLTCWACRHVSIRHAHALWWLFERKGWPNSFKELRKRCVCRACFERRNQIIRNPALELVHQNVTDEPLPLPSQEEWKCALRRHR